MGDHFFCSWGSSPLSSANPLTLPTWCTWDTMPYLTLPCHTLVPHHTRCSQSTYKGCTWDARRLSPSKIKSMNFTETLSLQKCLISLADFFSGNHWTNWLNQCEWTKISTAGRKNSCPSNFPRLATQEFRHEKRRFFLRMFEEKSSWIQSCTNASPAQRLTMGGGLPPLLPHLTN